MQVENVKINPYCNVISHEASACFYMECLVFNFNTEFFKFMSKKVQSDKKEEKNRSTDDPDVTNKDRILINLFQKIQKNIENFLTKFESIKYELWN